MPQLLNKGQPVKGETGNQYIVTRRLGEGQFAEVWEVKQCGTGADLRFALKLEKYPERKSVLHETKVLSKLPSKCEQVVSVIDTGYHGKHFFMIMELRGDTLFDVRKQAGGRLDLPTVKAVGLSTLAAIEGLHGMGFIHRDIKPANFVVNPPNAAASRGSWVLIDFGLARKFVAEDGSHMPPRADASFRGSTAYASVHAHRNEDLCRRDDLWSWFYMLLELVEGVLLWRLDKEDPRDHDKQWVLHEKEKGWQQPELLARSRLPDALLAMHIHIKSLGFQDVPDYQLLRTCLQQLPDEQVQLQLQHLIPQSQQPWGQNGIFQQQPQQQQQAWDHSPLHEQPVHQQQHSLPPSSDGMSPMDSLGAPVTGGKRRRASSAATDLDQQLKRPRPDSLPVDQACRQQERHGGRGRSCNDDGSRGDSRPGSLGPPQGASQEPHQAAAGGISCAQPRSGSGQDKQPSQQPNGAADLLPAAQQVAAASPAGQEGSAPAAGRAAEISDLLLAFKREAPDESRAATLSAVAGLCALGPVEAVCAISMTFEKLVKQSDVSCSSAVSQLLLDLAAFAAVEARAASQTDKLQQRAPCEVQEAARL